MKKIVRLLAVCIIIISVVISAAACSGDKDPIIAQCNGLSIERSTFMLLTIQEAVNLHKNEEGITEENIVEKAKEKALESIRLYTYYKQGYTELKYTLSIEDAGQLKYDILYKLITEAGFDFDINNEDAAFLENFGVTLDQYMRYYEELQLVEYFYNEKIKEIEIDDDEAYAFFIENKIEYASFGADVILLREDVQNKEETAELIKDRLINNASLTDIKNEFNDFINIAENIEIFPTSNLNDIFGNGLVETVIDSSESDVSIINNNKGTVIVRTSEILGYEQAKDKMIRLCRINKYAKYLEETTKSDVYDVTIIDRELYNSIKEIPSGTAVKSDNA